MVNYNPPKIAVALGIHHYTNKGIKENGSFSICIPSINLIEKTDYIGLVSGEKVDKTKTFSVFYGDNVDIYTEKKYLSGGKLDLKNMKKRFILFVSGLFITFGCFSQPANINLSNSLFFGGEPYLAVNPVNSQNMVVAWMALDASTGFRPTDPISRPLTTADKPGVHFVMLTP